ncbi:MAG: universal stress protein [Bacteroidetes bacterium]|nr:universal stress protein [Bacteroidota bacterium]
MENFKNWMVGLDLNSVDETILAYTQYLAEIFSPEKIHFVHIANPEALSGKEPNKEAIKAEMEVLVGGYFKDHPGTICEVYDGKPLFELWRESYLHNTDLFIVGSKHPENGRGIMPKKFVRKSFCSVLFIPEETKPNIDKILVPTDFSEYSSVALQSAIEISAKVNSRVLVHHVIDLPQSYGDQSRQEVIDTMMKQAEEEYKQFIRQFPPSHLSIEPLFGVREYSYVAEHIKNEAEIKKVNLIIMSAGGKSRLSILFLGSETEKILQMEKEIPVMILKQKVKDVKLWDILTSI